MTDWPLLLWRGTSSPAGFCRGRGGPEDGAHGRAERGHLRPRERGGPRDTCMAVPAGSGRRQDDRPPKASHGRRATPTGTPPRAPGPGGHSRLGRGRGAAAGEQRPPPPHPGHRAPSAAGDPAQGHPAGRRAGARARGGRDMRGPGPPRTWPPRRTPRDLPAQGGRDGAGPVSFRKDARSWFERARDMAGWFPDPSARRPWATEEETAGDGGDAGPSVRAGAGGVGGGAMALRPLSVRGIRMRPAHPGAADSAFVTFAPVFRA